MHNNTEIRYNTEMRYNTGNRLKQIRESRGWNRRQLSEAMEVSPSAYTKNESGVTFPSMRSLRSLFNKLSISMNWFFFGRGPVHFKEEEKAPPPPPPSSAELLGRKIEADPDIHEVVKAMLDNTLAKHQMLADFQRLKNQNQGV
ncbi:MAG: helix-turn-helix transcriptional regulator [bacterium]|nr:helix-turn-helix transcriptional regulator [bacterium]